MLVILRWTAVFLAATALLFAIRWPTKFPFRSTALLGGFSALTIAGSQIVFPYGTPLMVGGTAVGVGLVIASCWTIFHAGKGA